MKKRKLVTVSIFIIFLFMSVIGETQLIEKWIDYDYNKELIVTMKEKYGHHIDFYCNLIIKKNGSFILINKEGIVADLPCANWAILEIKK
jgi:hypothetical protein